jgi:serine/threonine protein kinase
MILDETESRLLTEALAPTRKTPPLNMMEFVKAMKLFRIGEYEYKEVLSGGGTNVTALYSSNEKNVVAKFFFTGPIGTGDAACHREMKMMKLCRSQEIVHSIEVAPQIVAEFASDNGMVVGFLMEYIQGDTLWDIMQKTAANDQHSALTTFVRIGWARHNALRATILHKDLHPGNIVFEMPNDEWESWLPRQKIQSPRVRLLDFGSAVMPLQFGYDTFDADWYSDLMRNFNGAFSCIAPEFFTKEFGSSIEGTQAFDCWAMGQLFYKILTKKTLILPESVGHYCDSIYSGDLSRSIAQQVDSNVGDDRLRFLIKSMAAPDFRVRVNMFSAIAYANCLRNNDPDVVALHGEELHRFVYVKGCDPEWGLPPHERKNSGY